MRPLGALTTYATDNAGHCFRKNVLTLLYCNVIRYGVIFCNKKF